MANASIRIAEWSTVGLRCPDHFVSFETTPGHVKPISLLQMPNGTGKTTTLGLLRAALSGEGPQGKWTDSEVHALRKSPTTTTGRFQLVLLHNTERVTITITFDFDDRTATYSTTTRAGHQDGFHPPRELQRFLNPAFVRFFVFDGELAESQGDCAIVGNLA